MRLTVPVQLRPTTEQARGLRETLERANAAANAISEVAWREQTFGQYALHHLIYHDIRERFDLSAQVVVRVISKVADAYKLDRKVQRVFRPSDRWPTTIASSAISPTQCRSGRPLVGSASRSYAGDASANPLPRGRGNRTSSTAMVAGI